MNPKTHRNFKTRPMAPAVRAVSPCLSWATLLPDAAEGLLGDVEQRALEQHLAGCHACTEELAEAQRGLAWLGVLKEQTPEPPATMLASILAQTTGYAEVGVSLPPMAHVPQTAPVLFPVASGSGSETSVSGWRGLLGLGEAAWSSLLQPRLAMTGAMAFFSICLTLNLFGISLGQLQAQTQRSGSLHRTVADTGASLVRSIQGLRVVYQVESRVSEMRAQMETPDSASAAR